MRTNWEGGAACGTVGAVFPAGCPAGTAGRGAGDDTAASFFNVDTSAGTGAEAAERSLSAAGAGRASAGAAPPAATAAPAASPAEAFTCAGTSASEADWDAITLGATFLAASWSPFWRASSYTLVWTAWLC